MVGLRLDALETAPVAGEGGKPLDLPLEVVHEDPDQPRNEFDKNELQKLAESIEKGKDGKPGKVHTPISVRPHDKKPGHYVLNFGARRLRASKMAGKATIPAFIDEKHDTFDQVIENTHRDPLKPMELALFFKRQKAAKVSATEISKRLSIDTATITHHAALIDMPGCIEAAYRDGRCTTARTLYDLRKLYDSQPERVKRWVEGRAEITRGSVKGLADKLKSQPASKPSKKSKTKAATGGPVVTVVVDGKSGTLIASRKAPKGQAWILIDDEQVQMPCSDCVLESVTVA